jgi:predicted unusual protein kinase regulating ubiquinone biosynthesis (AarF/ABC1/UbiB family)
MKPAEPQRTRRSSPRGAERREVEDCLARWGLLRRPRPLAGSPAAAEAFGRRLRGALQDLGPVFSAFGLYLASRIDLLTAADCLELATLSEAVTPMPVAAVLERIAAELGQPAETVLAALEPEPCESRLLVQAHRARLAGGRPVVLRLARAEIVEAAGLDLERLPLLAPAFSVQEWSDGVFGEAMADFQRSLRESVDLRATAEALDLLAVDAESFGLLAPPVVCRELSTARLLTVEDPGGTDLNAPVEGEPGELAARRREVARRVAVVWLRQALMGRVFPVRLRDAGVRVLENGRVTFLAGVFVRPVAADQASLRDFLVALAARDPDGACTHLLREMSRGPAASEDALRLQMRQVVPFRDGAWSPSGESLAEHVFVCARQARVCGFHPRLQLIAFYRGLASTAGTLRYLVPEEDALLAALHEVRVYTGVGQMREAMSPQWDQLGRYALLMTEMPRKIDELLTLASEGGLRKVSEADRQPRREEGSQVLLAASLMVLGGLALLLHHLVQVGALTGQRETAAAALFLLVGVFLLWTLTRNGGK